MRIIVTGSIAIDYLMTFSGRFTDSLVGDRLDKVSLSFLVNNLVVRRGGVAANISLGMARLGFSPVLAAAAGTDFGDYHSHLAKNGVDMQSVYLSDSQLTARFSCTTDVAQNQIASFYSGAMSEAVNIKLSDHEPFELALIGPNDPAAMLSYTDECRTKGYQFAADPSQQLGIMNGADIRRLVVGAAYLFTNEYEHALLLEKTGWIDEEVLDVVSVWITTRGSMGVQIERARQSKVLVPAVPARGTLEPTGVGDGFRAGFLTAIAGGLDLDDSAMLGCTLATLVLECDGPQEYDLQPAAFIGRLAEAYGDAPAARIAGRVVVLSGSAR
jgi:adenosine kinase